MGRYLSDREFQREMTKIKRENQQKEKHLLLKAEREKYKSSPRMETSKLIAVYLFVILNSIIVYAMIAMWHFSDLSYLGILISDIAAQVLIYAIYCIKAYHAKKQSEQVKLDREKLHGGLNDVLDAGGECESDVPLTRGSLDYVMMPDDYAG